MFAPSRRLLSALALTLLAGCKSDGVVGPFNTPLSADLQVGDLVRLNVNGRDACTNPIYHVARVVAISDRAMVFADTLNPAGGFTDADYVRYAAKFDTLVYPLDAGAFGEPTDIDNNGRIGIVFTRAVNELTPRGDPAYVGGFTFSRDLFPLTAAGRAQACPTSNQGEYFYALAPDPAGTINGNVRSTSFVNSATVPVLAHEFQHLINASRKLYINTDAPRFEDTWLDEGLAHIAEELLFYRESGTTPRKNLDLPAIQASASITSAFDDDMGGNADRYHDYLLAPESSSPWAPNDELTTRGAAWSLLRYLADQKVSAVVRTPGAAVELNGTGSVTVPGGTTGAQYAAVLVNSAGPSGSASSYTFTATNVITPTPSLIASAPATLSRLGAAAGGVALRTNLAFEARLRAEERAMLPPLLPGARSWYRGLPRRSMSASPSPSSLLVPSFTSPDGDIWYRLANNTLLGIANIENVFGVDATVAVRDWSASHQVDDVATTVAEFQQLSWNWHSLLPELYHSPYPVAGRAMTDGSLYSGNIIPGGAAFYRLAVPAAGTATLTVGSGSSSATGLRLVVVRTQ